MRQGADWAAVQRLLSDDSGALSDSYGRAEDSAPKDLRQPVKLMREFTAEAARLAARATSTQEFTALVVADRTRAMNAGRASQTVDAYTRANCGFSVSNEGAQ